MECLHEVGSLGGAAWLVILGVDGDAVEPGLVVEATKVVASVVVQLAAVGNESDRTGEDPFLTGVGSRKMSLLVLRPTFFRSRDPFRVNYEAVICGSSVPAGWVEIARRAARSRWRVPPSR